MSTTSTVATLLSLSSIFHFSVDYFYVIFLIDFLSVITMHVLVFDTRRGARPNKTRFPLHKYYFLVRSFWRRMHHVFETPRTAPTIPVLVPLPVVFVRNLTKRTYDNQPFIAVSYQQHIHFTQITICEAR